MRTAQDCKRAGLNGLRGYWKKAALASLLTTLLGVGVVSTFTSVSIDDVKTVVSFVKEFDYYWSLSKGVTILLVGIIAFEVISLLVGGAVQLGYAQFNINLADGKPASLRDVFSKMNRLWPGLCLRVMMALYTFFWSLLFLIPGIIKALSYSMAPYILAEDPTKTPGEAITDSQTIMHGEKWRLFCLSFSFIGWTFLCVIPMSFLETIGKIAAVWTESIVVYVICMIIGYGATIVGVVFLKAYEEATFAAFYRDLTRYKQESEEDVIPVENKMPDETPKANFRWPD